MAVMTTLSNDGVVEMQPVPSSEKMALDIDINGTTKRDETNLEFEIPKPSVIPFEPSPTFVSEIHRTQNNEAAAANDRIMGEMEDVIAPVIVKETKEASSIDAPTSIDVSTSIDASPTIAIGESEADKAVDVLEDPGETADITTTTTSAPIAAERTSSVDTSQAADSSFETPSAATTILPLVESQESDLRESALPVSQSEAEQLQAAKHAMDLHADPELANGLKTTAGNDVIERQMNGEGADMTNSQNAMSQIDNATTEGAIHSINNSTSAVEGDSQKTHNIENLQIEPASQSSFEQPQQPIAAASEPAPDVHMTEAENPRQDAEMDDLFGEPAPQFTGNKVAREREEDVDMDAPEAKRFKAESSMNGDAVEDDDHGGADRQMTPDLKRALKNSLQAAKKAKVGKPFAAPVIKLWENLTDTYLARVPNPMDISTIEKKLSIDQYQTLGQYKADVHLIYTNCILFNGPDHEITKGAADLETYLSNRIPSVDFVPPAPAKTKSRKSTPAGDLAARRPSRVVPSPPVKTKAEPYSESQTVRRDSNLGDNGRPKRETHPPKPKDFYTAPPVTKTNRKKNALELKFCDQILQDIMKPKHAAMNQFFMEPVDTVALGIPHYHNTIKKPMDLSTIKQKLSNAQYASAKDFEADFRLMLENCFLFNPPGNLVHHKGRDLERYFDTEWHKKSRWMETNGPRRDRGATPDSEEEQSDDGEEEAPSGPSSTERNSLSNRVMEEQEKLIALTTKPGSSVMEIQLQQQIVDICKANLKEMDAKISAAAKKGKKGKAAPKAAKKTSSSATKKAKKPKTRYIGHTEKEIISNGIGQLDDRSMQTVISWIRADVVGLEAVEDNEMELDIDAVSDACLNRLYDLVISKVPHILKKDDEEEQPTHRPAPTAKPKKKNKPMGKSEQERKIAQLQQVLGAGQSAPTAPAAQRYGDSGPAIEQEEESSGDEDDSESEED